MKFNSTIALTFYLLLMMIGAGCLSAFVGYTLGYESLQGVSQPDVNPTRKIANNKKREKESKQKGLTLVDERRIIVQFYDHIYKKQQLSNANLQTIATQTSVTPANLVQANSKFPLKGQDQNVTLEVVKASEEGAFLLLDMNLRNDGTKAVEFIYSFLDVRDDRERPLSATIEGLPAELPANGNNFSGKVMIPLVLLEDAKSLSLTLTDYPDQKLKLKITDIPLKEEKINP